jgi:thioredoxin-dependent peroxiredoxin
MVKEGEVAPEFALPTDDGSTISLSALKGKQVVLYFYPKDDTPGCTTESCNFRDNLSMLTSKGAVVLGISPQDVKSHAKFKEKYSLNFPLLVDQDHVVADKYGAWGLKMNYGKEYMGILRTTFVIDKDGIVKKVFEKVHPEGHALEVMAVL